MTKKKASAKRTKKPATPRKRAAKKATSKRKASKRKAAPRKKARHFAWAEPFLQALAEHDGHVGEACRAVGIHRSMVYNLRNKETAEAEGFARRWDEICEYHVDRLETRSMELAIDGWDEPVFHDGEECGMKRRFSPSLMMFLLRCRRPEVYNPRVGYGRGTVISAEDAERIDAQASALAHKLGAMIETVPDVAGFGEPEDADDE